MLSGNRRLFRVEKSKMNSVDKCKVSLLAMVYIVCFYSFLQTFAFVSPVYSPIKASYQFCSKIEEKLSDCTKQQSQVPCTDLQDQFKNCKEAIDITVVKANSICKPYKIKYDSCIQYRPMECTTERSNLDGCVASVYSSVKSTKQLSAKV
eukprot:gene14064-29939_t